MEITRHFTATTYVVHEGKVLLHLHRKQGLWLPPGGHIERDELPHDAARREVREETGLDVELHSAEQAVLLTKEMHTPVVPQPAFILVEDINPFHQHIDFTYFARLHGDRPEVLGFRWLAPEEIPMENAPQNVQVGARKAILYFT